MQKEDIQRIAWGARESEDDGGEKPEWLTDKKLNTFKRWGNIQAIRKINEQDERTLERDKLFKRDDVRS